MLRLRPLKNKLNFEAFLDPSTGLSEFARPDLAYDTNRLQTCVQKPVVQDLIDANSLLRRAQMTKDQKLVYGWNQFDFDKLEIILITPQGNCN